MADVRTEPSMEEILASIKRIIADDGLVPEGIRLRPRADATEPPPETVLELTETVAPPASPIAAPVPPAPPSAATSAHAAASPAVAPAPVPATTLVSDDAAAASRQSLSALSSMVGLSPASESSLDGLVRELLRPMLKEWLDTRLPAIVETLVSREIARITGKSL